jgi:hypothetical protein
MKIFRLILISVSIFLALTLGGLVYVSHQFPSWAKKYTIDYAHSMGYLLDFNELKVNFLSPSVSVTGLQIKSLDAQEPILNLPSIGIQFQWYPLLNRRLEIDAIQITSPQVFLSRSESEWNWLKMIDRIKDQVGALRKKDAPPSQPWLFLIQDIHLTQGILQIDDLKQSYRMQLPAIDLRLKQVRNFNQASQPGHIESDYVIELGEVIVPIPNSQELLELGKVSIDGDIDFEQAQQIRLNVQLKIADGLVKAKTVFQLDTKDINSEIEFERLDLTPFVRLHAPHILKNDQTGNISGQVKVAYQEQALKLSGGVDVQGLDLVPWFDLMTTAQPLIAKSGLADGKLQFDYQPKSFQVKADLGITKLQVFETDQKSELIAWQRADLRKIDFFMQDKIPKYLYVESVKVDGLSGKLTIYDDKTTNIGRLFKPAGVSIKEPAQGSLNSPEVANTTQVNKPLDNSNPRPKQSESAMQFNMQVLAITKGKIDFTDYAVKPNFKTEIHDFHGTLVGVSTQPKRYATAAFNGLIDESGDMQLRGQIAFENPRRNNEISLSFRRVPLSSINPYYTNFAGYTVLSGAISYDSFYRVRDGQLEGDNRFVINQMKLGEPIPGFKGRNIPLRLLVALLEDSDGVIDLDLRVAGDIDHPDFQVSSLLWDAFFKIVENIVKAPFRLLARLVGIENFPGIFFEAGSDQLRPSELLKLERMITVLTKRPKLVLQIHGSYDPVADQAKLAADRVTRQLLQLGGFPISQQEPLPDLPLADGRVQQAILKMYAAKNLTVPPDLKLISGVAGEPNWRILYRELIAREVVSEESLTALARNRAQATKKAILEKNSSIEQQITLGDLQKDPITKDGVSIGINASTQ